MYIKGDSPSDSLTHIVLALRFVPLRLWKNLNFHHKQQWQTRHRQKITVSVLCFLCDDKNLLLLTIKKEDWVYSAFPYLLVLSVFCCTSPKTNEKPQTRFLRAKTKNSFLITNFLSFLLVELMKKKRQHSQEGKKEGRRINIYMRIIMYWSLRRHFT